MESKVKGNCEVSDIINPRKKGDNVGLMKC